VLERVRAAMIAEGRDGHVAGSFHRSILVGEEGVKPDNGSWRTQRVKFDPRSPSHRLSYANFLETGKWTIHFEVVLPYTNVPQMIEKMLLEHVLRAELARVRKAKRAAEDKAQDPNPVV
jgi:hypothetical protein